MLRLAALGIPLLPLAAAYEWYDVNNQPTQPWQKGQVGHNACGSNDSQDSMCQTVMINTVEDFCLWAPPNPDSEIGNTEAEEVAWCTASGHGARIMPQGTIHSAHMLKTPHYTQITGTGDFTKLNVRSGDSGGELDPHGADGTGNPRGGLVYYNGQQIQEWNSFISDTEFCIRVCPTSDPDAWQWCQHIYDTEGCGWNQPGEYGDGFDTCQGDSTSNPPGIYPVNGGLSTYSHENGAAPTPHAAGASSNCQAAATVGGQGAVAASPTTAASSSSASSMSSALGSAGSSRSSGLSGSSGDSSFSTSTVSSASSSMISSSVSSSSSSDSSSVVSTSTIVSSASVVTSTSTLSRAPSSSSSSTPARQAAASTTPSSSADRTIASIGLALFGGALALFA